jgi:hypothetical protein
MMKDLASPEIGSTMETPTIREQGKKGGGMTTRQAIASFHPSSLLPLHESLTPSSHHSLFATPYSLP